MERNFIFKNRTKNQDWGKYFEGLWRAKYKNGKDFANNLGCSPAAITKWNKGIFPGGYFIQKIARDLEISIDELIWGKKFEYPGYYIEIKTTEENDKIIEQRKFLIKGGQIEPP